MILSRALRSSSLKHFKLNTCFVTKEFFSHGTITYKGYGPSAFFKRAHRVFPVRDSEPVSAYSSLAGEKGELDPRKTAENSENELQVDMFALTGGDPAVERQVKILHLEREIMKQEGQRVPSQMTTNEWKELLKLTSRSSRKKYLSFLFAIEMRKENRKRKKEEKRALEINKANESENCDRSDCITYGFKGSTIFVRVYDSTMNNFYNYNAIRAMMFGQKLVFDCSYDPHMTSRESQNCAKQLMIAFSDNRIHSDPFDLYLTGGSQDCRTISHLHKYIPTMYDDTFPLTVTSNSYLELFPRENLVYLTPHCREELLHYDHDAVYIIGAMVDKVNSEPLSLAKAKREGLKMAKLPIDRYLDWGSGSGKSLTLNQMLKILLDQKHMGDWKKSLLHVPRRKLIRETPVVKPFKKNFAQGRINFKNLMS
ncbi:mitochondrial ribonuclease P protein 1 homolog [Hetaerina americana]|uniref:mitochondrial ribonuclease P protein 1 homolog n=1 Tax=Hetaerina americana TaxID=62018 RepID=UPI003A7F4974